MKLLIALSLSPLTDALSRKPSLDVSLIRTPTSVAALAVRIGMTSLGVTRHIVAQITICSAGTIICIHTCLNRRFKNLMSLEARFTSGYCSRVWGKG